MMRFIISLLVVLVFVTFLSGCSYSRKSKTELRGLMLMENTQLGRNRSYYSRYGEKKLVNKHQKFHRKIRKKALRKR
jgi:hypothetical protein